MERNILEGRSLRFEVGSGVPREHHRDRPWERRSPERHSCQCQSGDWRSRGRCRGIALAWTALVLLVMIGIVGLSIDWGMSTLAAHQLQNGADAAALAGALALGDGPAEARAAAVKLGAANLCMGAVIQLDPNPSNLEAGDVVLGVYNQAATPPSFTPGESGANAVKVAAPRVGDAGISLIFGPIFGTHRVNVVREAIAWRQVAPGAGLLILNQPPNTKNPALYLDSNALVEIEGGGVYVNGNALLKSNSGIVADSFGATGYIDQRNTTVGYSGGELSQNTGYTMPDPLADLPAPVPGPNLGGFNKSSGTYTIGPGYYSGGIRLDSTARLTLLPGIYILDGYGLELLSNSSLTGSGVMLYITNKVKSSSRIYLDSNPQLTLSPPTEGPYKGIALFQARDNYNKATLNSNTVGATFDFGDGIVYLPSAHLYIDSNVTLDSTKIVVNTAEFNSNAKISVSVGADSSPRRIVLVK